MAKIILIDPKGAVAISDTLADMFQTLSEAGTVVTTVEDGVLETSVGTFTYGELQTEGSKAKFVTEVETYRGELRASVSALKKQGIGISKTELTKLGKQFAFLAPAETPKKETVEKKETAPKKEEAPKEATSTEAGTGEDEIPV